MKNIRLGTANRKPLIVNRKAMALFMPIFTIAFIIALFTLVTYSLSDNVESLQSNGVGAEAVIVTKTLWTKEIEIVAQESMLKTSLCTALTKMYTSIGEDFENIDFARLVEKTLQESLQKESEAYAIGLTSVNPVSFHALPKSIEERKITMILYNPDAGATGIKKRTINITRPTIHEIKINSSFNISPIILAHDKIREVKRGCALNNAVSQRK